MPAHTPDYLRPYTERLAETGPTFDALLWNNPESQAARFRTITEIIDLNQRNIIDAGCGRGDLARWLKQHTTITPARYTGIDALEPLLAVGREHADQNLLATTNANTNFIHADFASAQNPDFYLNAANTRTPANNTPPDLIIFSGSLNTFEEKHARGVLRWAWKATADALVFNFLSDKPARFYKGRSTGPAKRFNTLRMLRWAFTKTHIVALRHDYLNGNDCTILMRKPTPRRDNNAELAN